MSRSVIENAVREVVTQLSKVKCDKMNEFLNVIHTAATDHCSSLSY